jgi:hypothetical protein
MENIELSDCAYEHIKDTFTMESLETLNWLSIRLLVLQRNQIVC